MTKCKKSLDSILLGGGAIIGQDSLRDVCLPKCSSMLQQERMKYVHMQILVSQARLACHPSGLVGQSGLLD